MQATQTKNKPFSNHTGRFFFAFSLKKYSALILFKLKKIPQKGYFSEICLLKFEFQIIFHTFKHSNTPR
ncbi:hypothetical protein B0A70_09390 [Chryseobacterium piscicola]|uniref:Uncharacterized protein n=1 Tax=Chryseobacterium piscicola TaxID=551459 RepID=A0A2S7KEV3_9FLAO|nr:hypothetical protein B0A70_09390 [Chryseobacterium piscicola]